MVVGVGWPDRSCLLAGRLTPIVTPTPINDSHARPTGVGTIVLMAKPSTSPPSWTTRKLLAWTSDHFAGRGIDSPRIAAEMLLAHVLNVNRIQLYTDMDRPASPLERAAFRELVERASAHEPVQYLVGEAHLFSMSFEVDRNVLIPRPSTETLIEHVVQHARRTPGFHEPVIADVGTGSGCIAIALARHLPDAKVVATDISGAALAVARRNAQRHGVADRIEFKEGSLYEPLNGRFAFICSNPPYIPDDEWEQVGPNVKDYEPTQALRGGVDGMDYVRPLIEPAAGRLREPGQVVVEIAASRKAEALAVANACKGLDNSHVLADAEGHPRVLIADRA